MGSPLVRWLAGLPTDDLATILARRPDALTGPGVADLPALAARLQARDSVAAALAALPRPAIQLIEVLQAFGGPSVRREQLAAVVGRTPQDPELDATLQVLAQRALVWPDGDDLRMAGALWSAFEHPLGLGPPAGALLNGFPSGQLNLIADALGVPRGRTRDGTMDGVCAALADGERVRALVASAPDDVRDLLMGLAQHGPVVPAPQHSARPAGVTGNTAVRWAARHGLLVWDGWQHARMPGEVAMALRGSNWRAPFDPRPPRPATVDAPTPAVAREAAAAAITAVERTSALLDAVAATPVRLLKAGGVGNRELRRLAKSVGASDLEIRLWLELAYAAGLAGVSDEQVLPTDGYDAWCADEPAQRLPVLLRAWRSLPAAPLAERRVDGGSPAAALLRDPTGLMAYDLRPALLEALAELPESRGVADAEGAAALVRWRLPLAAGSPDEDEHLITGLWREAHLVGAVAHGALTPLGRALLDERPTRDGDLLSAAHQLLPPSVREAVFQNDLTVVVPGTPAAALAGLLDTTAVRESRGGATTWRLSAASIRAALDAGRQADELLSALRTVAVGGSLPQVLEYLVADTARQHGRIRVRRVGCVLRAEDPALLAEIAGVRALRPLGLAVLAPTVLASARPLPETLAALRAAGYAPLGEDAQGMSTVERVHARRAPASRRLTYRSGRAAAEPVDPTALAGRLLAAPSVQRQPDTPAAVRRPLPHAPTESTGVADAVRRHASQLDDYEQGLLIEAINEGTPVTIDYTDASGRSSTRVVEPLDLDRHLLVAWCHRRGEERMFALDRIATVLPA